MEILERIRLEPVLELEPGDYRRQERSSPEVTFVEAPEAWDRYWRDSLSDSGLAGLLNLRPGSWQVPLRTLLKEDDLEKILRVELRHYEPLSVDQDPVLNGGLALLEDERTVLEAQCCGDLANLRDWNRAAHHVDPGWECYWIGHPQLPVRRVDGWLELAEPAEDRPPEPSWRVRPEQLQKAATEARRELERLVPRVRHVLERWSVKGNLEELALNLAGLRPE